jgi:predicted O-methyltransferase YrrM
LQLFDMEMAFCDLKWHLKKWLKMSDIEEEYLERIMGVEGQIIRSEARTLVELARSIKKDEVIVEIGSYRGRSTIALAYGALLGNRNRVYAIDPHREFQGVMGGEFGPRDQEDFYKNLLNHRVADIVAVVSLPSVSASKAWPERNVGLLWIDGDHRYEAVHADFEAWRPFFAKGAILAFHDIEASGVRRVIEHLTRERMIAAIGQTDSLQWFKETSAQE